MSDLTTATLAAITAKDAQRLEMYRCSERCRLAGVFKIRGTVVWVEFNRGAPSATLTRPDGVRRIQCKHGMREVEFRA